MRIQTLLRAGLLTLGLLAASCTSDSEDGKGPGGGGKADGVFRASLIPRVVVAGDTFGGTTAVGGKVFDGPNPEVYAWKEAAKSGSCRLLVPEVPFCSPACGSNILCVSKNVCMSYPTAIGVGRVTLEGLKTTSGATTFSMDPTQRKDYQLAAGTVVAFPPFEEGATVTLKAAGAGSVGPFTVTAKGIAPLAILNDSIVLAEGQAIQLKWTPAAEPTASRIKVEVDISHHGGTKGLIECETADAGSLEIPASLLDQLKALGVAGFPKMDITREAVGASADVDVDLVLESIVTKDVRIPGLVSCSEDGDCPSDKTCQPEMFCK